MQSFYQIHDTIFPSGSECSTFDIKDSIEIQLAISLSKIIVRHHLLTVRFGWTSMEITRFKDMDLHQPWITEELEHEETDLVKLINFEATLFIKFPEKKKIIQISKNLMN